MRTGWGDRELDLPRHPVADRAAARRATLAAMFPGERLVLPAGTYKVRANDTDYRFRPDTAHTYFSGNQTSDAVLVIEDGESVALRAAALGARHRRVLPRPAVRRAVGRAPPLAARALRLARPRVPPHRPAPGRPDRVHGTPKTRVLRGVSAEVDGMVAADEALDEDFARVVGELRLVKDDWEVAELQEACDITTLGFEDSVREWQQVLEYGERWIEGTFFRRARAMGNDIGYDSIVGGGKHATTLHWIDNTGPITPGELVLLDMGVEGTNLYTADVTRTLPVDGTFTPLQRDLYDLVYTAQQAGIEAGRPGRRSSPRTTPRWTCSPTASRTSACSRSPPRRRSTRSRRSTRAGPCTAPATCSAWTSTTATRASPDIYPKGNLEEGMVLTVEPGLYFQEDDLLVPEELRGIGIRIEDDILVTADGRRNLSDSLPRTSADVEAWMGQPPALTAAGTQYGVVRATASARLRSNGSACMYSQGRPIHR